MGNPEAEAWGDEPKPVVRRVNPSALVEHFVAGVNEAGGVWTCASGKPFADLAAALQAHAAVEPAPERGLAVCRALGNRWFAYCDGHPRDAWKAAAWLGEGAPASKPVPAAVQAGDAAAKARRAEEAKMREREQERRRREEEAVPMPSEARALFANIGRGPL